MNEDYLKKEGIIRISKGFPGKTFRPAETNEPTGRGFSYKNAGFDVINTGERTKEKTIIFGETNEKAPKRPEDFFRPKKYMNPMDKSITFNQDIVV